MANELPYFRFVVSAWQNGKIALENFELQGLFISVCGYYWMQDCSITLAMLQKKFSNARPELIQELIDLNILKHENRHDKVQIEFLNIQFDLLSEKRKLRQAAGSRGGNAKAMLKQNPSYKDKDNNKDKDKDKDKYNKTFNPPSCLDVVSYFKEKGYSEAIGKKAFEYYNEADWKDSKGKQVKNWKQKMQGVWFKDENKIKAQDKNTVHFG